MAKQRMIFAVLACFCVAILAAQLPARAVREFPRPKPGMTKEEYDKQMREFIDEPKRKRDQQKQRDREERHRLVRRDAWKHLLGINDAQWAILELRVDRIPRLFSATQAGAPGWGGLESLHWHRHSEGIGLGIRAKTPEEMAEGEKISDALVDLLEDPNSTDAQIRKKIDALQQAREHARAELAQIRKELAPLLTTPRQQAMFLIMGCID